MLSFRIIYALFSQLVGFWGLRRQPPSGFHPWTMLGNFHPQTLNLPTPAKIILRVPMQPFM